MTRAGAEALITLADAVLWNHRTRVVELTAQHRLPAMFPEREFADAGGFMAYGPSVPDSFRRAAVYVDRILKGAKPGDLPVEQPTQFDLVINLKTAKALGITMPPTLLMRADAVIK
jgi:putative ABC transport system substrate-binding protein